MAAQWPGAGEDGLAVQRVGQPHHGAATLHRSDDQTRVLQPGQLAGCHRGRAEVRRQGLGHGQRFEVTQLLLVEVAVAGADQFDQRRGHRRLGNELPTVRAGHQRTARKIGGKELACEERHSVGNAPQFRCGTGVQPPIEEFLRGRREDGRVEWADLHPGEGTIDEPTGERGQPRLTGACGGDQDQQTTTGEVAHQLCVRGFQQGRVVEHHHHRPVR